MASKEKTPLFLKKKNELQLFRSKPSYASTWHRTLWGHVGQQLLKPKANLSQAQGNVSDPRYRGWDQIRLDGVTAFARQTDYYKLLDLNMYHQVSTFHCNWYESTSATATPQPNVSQWIFPGPPFRLLLRLQQLLSSSEGPLTGSHLKKTTKQTSFATKNSRSEKQFVFQYQGGLPLFSSSWTLSNLLFRSDAPKRHLKKRFCLGLLGAWWC